MLFGESRKRTHLKLLVAIALVMACLLVDTKDAFAEGATSYTYALDDNGEWNRTQDAYLPDRTLVELGLSSPSDLFIDGEDMLYIVDTGNRRVVKYDINAGEIDSILTSDSFSSPMGICVVEDGTIYVADTGAKSVLVFDQDYNLLRSIGRPDSVIFADTNYEPKKIAVDNGGNIYLISEGVYSGIIQLANTGEFLGYFAVNDTNLTFSQRVQRMLFTRAQLANLVDANPSVFTNLFVDQEGIVYSVTSGVDENGVKKHNTSGGNMFKNDVFSWGDEVDVWVDESGIIYTVTSSGYIDVYSRDGEAIFSFGSYVTTSDVVGLFTKLASVAVDSSGNIWALDSNKGYVQSFKPTEYAQLVYSAMSLYEGGYYEEALEKWNEVLRLNQMSVLAHDGAGKAYFHAEDYETALEHFEVANDKSYYSEAFWEVRNAWLQKNLNAIALALVVLFIFVKVLQLVDRRTGGRIAALKKKGAEGLHRVPVLKEFLYAFHTSRHPMDSYYDIKRHGKGSVLSATVIYALFFAIYMLYRTKKGFIYQSVSVEDMDIAAIVIGFFVILILFILCNYLVTSINDGNGTLRDIYLVPAYGLMPVLVVLAGVTVISYGLTTNEAFLLTIALVVGISWSVVTIFIGLQTVHEYEFKETVMSLVMTAIFMIIVAVVGIILSIMWNSLYSFLAAVGKEAIQNVL